MSATCWCVSMRMRRSAYRSAVVALRSSYQDQWHPTLARPSLAALQVGGWGWSEPQNPLFQDRISRLLTISAQMLGHPLESDRSAPERAGWRLLVANMAIPVTVRILGLRAGSTGSTRRIPS
jgi:hypothetical protein